MLSRPPVALTDDELTRLGIVLTSGVPAAPGDLEAGPAAASVAAHYVRPLARDAHGHVQPWDPRCSHVDEARADSSSTRLGILPSSRTAPAAGRATFEQELESGATTSRSAAAGVVEVERVAPRSTAIGPPPQSPLTRTEDSWTSPHPRHAPPPSASSRPRLAVPNRKGRAPFESSRTARESRTIFRASSGSTTTFCRRSELRSSPAVTRVPRERAGEARMARSAHRAASTRRFRSSGGELNDDPLGTDQSCRPGAVDERGDATPIDWLPRDRRYAEKLATARHHDRRPHRRGRPGARRRGRYLSDELAALRLIPALNRGIFAINELPDLAERIQVGLLNILEIATSILRGFVAACRSTCTSSRARTRMTTRAGAGSSAAQDRLGSQIRPITRGRSSTRSRSSPEKAALAE